MFGTFLMPRVGHKPLVALGMLIAAGAMIRLTRRGPHTGYVDGVLGPLVLTGIGLGMVIAPSINTGTFGVASAGCRCRFRHRLTAHVASARVLGRQALTGLALADGYDTAFWWTAGLFAVGAVAGGMLFRRGPLRQRDAASGSPAGTPAPSPTPTPAPTSVQGSPD